MKIEIDITAEQLIKTALHRYKTQHESPDILLGSVIASLNVNTDSATVIRQAVTNSIAAGIERMERQAMAAEQEFATVGQMSLLGDLIPEHQIPSEMQTQSAEEVNAWMQNRAQIERENLEELRAALERQEQKTKRFTQWATATQRVCDALQRAGLDPAKVSYAEAIDQAETLQPRRGADAGPQAKQPLR